MTAVTAGAFRLIYDPSVGEAEPWYINDHTFFRDHEGAWHLGGFGPEVGRAFRADSLVLLT